MIDFILAGLPVYLLWDLQIIKQKKIIICGLFGLCLVPTLASITRTVYVYKAYFEGWDFTCKLEVPRTSGSTR